MMTLHLLGQQCILFNLKVLHEDWYANRNDLSCEQKLSMALTSDAVVTGVTSFQSFNDCRLTLHVQHLNFLDTRPHYWFVVISNCGGEKMNLDYELEFTNAGGDWERQFSYDEQSKI